MSKRRFRAWAIKLTIIVSIFGITSHPAYVEAIGVIEQDPASQDILYYAKGCPPGKTKTSTPSSGGGGGCGEQGYADGARNSQANKDQIYNFFKAKGLSDVAIAGIMGNMEKESAFMPDANNNNQEANQGMVGGGCRGIVQWCADRNQGLQDFADAKGEDWTCLGTQLEYIWHEVTETGEAGVMDNLNAATTPGQAADVWAVEYERMKPSEQTGRAAAAEELYKEFTGQSAPSTPPSEAVSDDTRNNDDTNCEQSAEEGEQGNGVTTGEFGEPLANATITECYGGGLRGGSGHYAMDWSSTGGTGAGGDVVAVDGGEVVASTDGGSPPFQGFGNTVVVKHSNGYYSRYSHLDSRSVKVGDKVSKGQKLGVEGNTGYSSGTHLDFGISKDPNVPNNSASENPLKFIKVSPSTNNQANCTPDQT